MGLFSRSKKIRTTADAETLRKVFDEDYALYRKVGESDDLKRFYELDEYVNSPVFKNKRKQIEHLKYKESEYYNREKDYKKLLKAEKLRNYYLIKESQELQGYLKIKETDEYAQYARLRVIVTTPGFDKKLRPEEYVAYRNIVAHPKIKALILFEKNKRFRHYAEVKATTLPQEFEKLTAYIKSDEFRKNREYLLNKKRYETTDDYKLLCEYEALKKRPDVVKYFSLQSDVHFKNMCRWEPVFEDTFRGGSLDEQKWITRYYAGERFLNDTYGVGDDVQLFLPENISFTERSVQLNFKKEQIIGKYWDASLGIREKKYEYTSAALSTACAFRQCFGRFEAKIKVNHSSVMPCFGMRGDRDMPHIEIMKFGTNGLQMGKIYTSKGKVVNEIMPLKDIHLSNDFYIFTLEWTREKMVWMVNDTVVKEVHENIPDIPMYVFFRLGCNQEPGGKCVPSRMEIEWVRFYKMKDEKGADVKLK